MSIKVGETSKLEITLPTSLELIKTFMHQTKAQAIGAVTATYEVGNPSISIIGKNGKVKILKLYWRLQNNRIVK